MNGCTNAQVLPTNAPAVNNATLTLQLNGSTVNTFSANASSNVTADIKALPNFNLNIGNTNAGNPRQVKFLSINYTNVAAYFKMSATSCHDNGTSYQFLEDLIIGCTTSGIVVCNVYKYCQASAGTLDNVERFYGDVFYTIDTTNKVVDFYILLGQYSAAQFTPITKIGNTSTDGVTQLSGTPTYYSSGTKTWGDGVGSTYALKSYVDAGLATKQNTITLEANLEGSKSVSANSEATIKSATLTANTRYLIMGFVDCSVADSSTIMNCAIKVYVSGSKVFQREVRTTLNSGGGCFTAGIYTPTSDATVQLTTYNYSSSARTFWGSLQILKI